ncbi:MAG: hypothetical protein ACI4JB_04100 [Porcipelethomonas sp.]
MVNDLPRITNEAEMREALSGEKTLYAVLNASVTGSAVEDVFDILAEDYIYIMYSGEEITASIYYPEGLGAETTYSWEKTDDIRKAISGETYLYNDIPIDLTECLVEKADRLSSENQVKQLKNPKAYVDTSTNYYYPDGMEEDPDDMGKSCGLTRYDVQFLKSGTALSFMAWAGDNEITVYKSDDENYALETVVQHGEMSDLHWVFESGDVGGVILVWIGVLFVVIVIPLSSACLEEMRESKKTENKAKNKRENKKGNKKRKRRKK